MSEKISSWGQYPKYIQFGHAPHWRADIPKLFAELKEAHGSTLPFGNGRSYGDSCLASSGHILTLNQLDRFISVNWNTGVVRAEAGTTLAGILDVAIPNGWFLPVTPGTQFVTLGGAVANDVHGKNHHVRGTFGNHVNCFGLLREGQTEQLCSETANTELFTATIGGLGLTGIITWVEIQLIPIRSSQIDTTTVRFDSLSEFFSLSEELDHTHEYSVAWIDCLAKGDNAGRGVFIAGNHANYGDLSNKKRPKLMIPITPPISLINRLSLKPFNEVYWRAHPRVRTETRVNYEPFFYPLDRILFWNRIYGRKGFQQYQCVVPDSVAKDAIGELLRSIADSGQGSFLAVLKRCGVIASKGLMSFPMPGTSLALDFPQNNDLITELFPRLDSIVRQAGGRLYPAKDAHMTSQDFQLAYPNWEAVEALRSPSISSCFWKRVTS